ncbi:coagulation factor XIII B chain-like isoform X2 [Cebidichthys violaceus]|uniref:coagulation factor XIII B chain-like isoform X2 n=1 Tax=Cebidichthys violaceus TaxID=271503 RepID=UPI0035CC6758
MRVRYLGIFLLACFPGSLHAQSATQPCSAPTLNDGYLVPEQDAYNHDAKLTYACDNGRKPAVEGWWATSTCRNGTWSPEPQCIDEKACIAPDIPNAIYTTNGWYEDGHKIRIACNEGYNPKDHIVTTTCNDGIWSSVPVCEKNINACGEPPQIPHAVIIFQGYQEVFAEYTKVKYECEDGYTVEGADDRKSVHCVSGNWTEGPVCHKGTERGAGLGGSAEVGTGGRRTTSTGSGTQPAVSRPATGHGGGSAGSGTQPAVSRPATGHGGGSAGSGTQPAGGGTSPTSGWNERDSRPQYTNVRNCGANPIVPNGVVMKQSQMSLKYQCNAFYTQVGSDTVKCYNNGSWSQPPICQAFCFLNHADPAWRSLGLSGDEYIKEGEDKYLSCGLNSYIYVKCINRKTVHTRCCDNYYHYYGQCP